MTSTKVGITSFTKSRDQTGTIKKIQKEDLSDSLPEELSKAALGQEIGRINFIHEISDGQSIRFGIEQESDGTRKMFELSGIWMDVLSEGKIIIIDEFDNSLHQHLLNFLPLLPLIHLANPIYFLFEG